MIDKSFERLRDRLATIADIDAAEAILDWDRNTYMPPGGAEARGEQMAALARLSHDLFISDETGDLIERAAQETHDLPADSMEVRLVRVARRDYSQARRIPPSLIAEFRRHAAAAHPVWVEARQNDDYPSFAPYLQRSADLSRELAEHLGYPEQPYDALLDQYEPGMRTAPLQTLFAQLKEALVPLVAAITASPIQPDASFLHQPFDEAVQERFGLLVIQRYGYDLRRGRLDRTVHPFQISASRDDARVATRYDPNVLTDNLFSNLHEAGHALYEQGLGERIERTPLASGASLGLHESQSRLWENVIGRSRPFWQHFYPLLTQHFPQLGPIPLDTFYAAINQVHPSFIRVEADEVTYNLHILLRFELELGLLDGSIPVEEAPTVWNDKLEAALGIRPPDNRVGILQDTHWADGSFGYFPTYTLGNILSVQLYQAALAAHPSIPEEIEEGSFATIRGWLTEQVYQYGRMFEPTELIERVTGSPMMIDPYLGYLRHKFGELYEL